jgi:hypothetical protein
MPKRIIIEHQQIGHVDFRIDLSSPVAKTRFLGGSKPTVYFYFQDDIKTNTGGIYDSSC